MNVTILIPTKNRSEFIERLLAYYSRLAFKGWIFIGDSSNHEHWSKTQAALRTYGAPLNVRHFDHAGMGGGESMIALSREVQTNYCTFIGDDDLMVPAGIEKCISFLEANPDYVGAHGHGVYFSLDREGPYGKIASLGYYKAPILTQETAEDRLRAHFEEYSVSIFSVFRRDVWLKMWERTPGIPDIGIRDEITPGAIAAVLGKIGLVDGLTMFRQVAHEKRAPAQNYWQNLLTDGFTESHRGMVDRILSHMGFNTVTEFREKRRLVESAFAQYFAYYAARDAGIAVLPKTSQHPTWTIETIIDPAFPYRNDFIDFGRALVCPK